MIARGELMTVENIITLLAVWLINAVTMFFLLKDPEISKLGDKGKPLVSKKFIWI